MYIINENINMKLKTKHENTKTHLYNANYITEEVIYHDVILANIEKIIFEHANIFKYRFNEFLIKVKCLYKLSHDHEYFQTHCNNRRNTFHFACRQWYSYNNPGILT